MVNSDCATLPIIAMFASRQSFGLNENQRYWCMSTIHESSKNHQKKSVLPPAANFLPILPHPDHPNCFFVFVGQLWPLLGSHFSSSPSLPLTRDARGGAFSSGAGMKICGAGRRWKSAERDGRDQKTRKSNRQKCVNCYWEICSALWCVSKGKHYILSL